MNALTSQQRSQLLRTTQKLGRLLGTTPALIEESDEMPSMLPLNLQRLAVPLDALLSSVYDDDHSLARYPSSDTTASSVSSHGSLKRNSSSSSDSRYSSKSARGAGQTQSVHVNADRPFLRIAVKRPPQLESIPQSPPADACAPPPPYSPAAPHTSFTIRPIPTVRASATAPPPAFAIPSAGSIRRQKMDRLRRTLGDGVPLDLVFPDEETRAVPTLHASDAYGAPQRIRNARDSLVVSGRYTPQPVRAAPPPPTPTPTSRAEKKLSIIRESEEPYHAPYEGDTEADADTTRHRRSSRLYDDGDARRIKRVPVPTA